MFIRNYGKATYVSKEQQQHTCSGGRCTWELALLSRGDVWHGPSHVDPGLVVARTTASELTLRIRLCNIPCIKTAVIGLHSQGKQQWQELIAALCRLPYTSTAPPPSPLLHASSRWWRYSRRTRVAVTRFAPGMRPPCTVQPVDHLHRQTQPHTLRIRVLASPHTPWPGPPYIWKGLGVRCIPRCAHAGFVLQHPPQQRPPAHTCVCSPAAMCGRPVFMRYFPAWAKVVHPAPHVYRPHGRHL